MNKVKGRGAPRRSNAALWGGFIGFCGLVAVSAPGLLATRAPAQVTPHKPTVISMRDLAPSAFRAPSKIDYQLLDARFAQASAKADIVGMAVAVIENGEISFVKGYGVTAANGTERVGVRTVFRWASLSKGVAATMIGTLAQDGRLSLNDPISRYSRSLRLPGGAEQRTTIDDVLSHRVGLAHNAYDDRLEGGQDPRLIRASLGNLNMLCAPGTCHSYQNVAFDSASEVVESVTGRTYGDVVRERLFAPLGMTNASMTRAGLIGSPSWARPHIGRSVLPVEDAYYRVPAAGGVNSSIFDLALWMRAQMGLAPEVLSPGVLDIIHQGRVDADRRRSEFARTMGPSRYALGWRDYNYLGHALIGHQGAVKGYRSTILFDPATKSGVVVLWNSQSSRPIGVQMEVFEMLYGMSRTDWLKLDKPELPAGGVVTAAR